MFQEIARRITDRLTRLSDRVSSLERQSANAVRDGKVMEVDPEKRRVRLQVGGTDDAPLLSPWVPYVQTAGALKVHTPPSVGQQMMILTPGGDARRARALPFTWSQDNPAPSDSGSEHVLTIGDVRIELRGGELVVNVPRLFVQSGGTTFEVTGGGIKAVGASIETEGEALTHNGSNIGFDHVHTEVEKGGDNTGPPLA